ARYGLHFEHGPGSMEAGLMYQAAAAGQVDVVSAYSTDGRVQTADLVLLEDDLHFFSPYEAVPIIRKAALTPPLRDLLQAFDHAIGDSQMRQMNLEVDAGKRTPEEVARQFLKDKALHF